MSTISKNTASDYEEILGIYLENFHDTFIVKLDELFLRALTNNIGTTEAIKSINEYSSIIDDINSEFEAIIKKNLVLDDKTRSYKTMIEELYDKYEEEDS